MVRNGVLVLVAVALRAQTPPPADLMPTMRAMADALGVSCNFCHSAERGSGLPEPKKDIARKMMAMTRDLNATVQAATGKPATEATRVQCLTCHRGVAIPEQLSDLIWRTLREKGTAAAVAEYRDLRKRYYGHSSYDFSDDTLIGVAQKLMNSKVDDAMTLLQLNIELNPQSERSYVALAYAYTRKIDDASAITNLEKALEIEPGDNVARGQLEQLKEIRRRRKQ